ncbi:MAG: HmuY family protein, partial [Bacteroidota bacterium]
VATDVEADPTTGRDPNSGRPISNDLFTLFDLDAGQIVLSSSQTDAATRAADSASTAWDIGFKGTTLIFNGGASGPGQGSAQLLTQTFDAVTEAPATGYATDGSNTCPAVETPGGTFPGAPNAICTGSDNGWYNYNAQQNLIAPLAGRTIVLTTGDGNYAKVRILSYYQGNPTTPDPNTDASRYYAFEYIVQPDGSRDFETTEG